ncbi:hypothetical protein QE152_g1682 [Popillia japonica]|uniref:Uncharacterized protein n=1 Tax=Popillia japonica TaxID=7064 RepID=A0AAW1N651_POPJA
MFSDRTICIVIYAIFGRMTVVGGLSARHAGVQKSGSADVAFGSQFGRMTVVGGLSARHAGVQKSGSADVAFGSQFSPPFAQRRFCCITHVLPERTGPDA